MVASLLTDLRLELIAILGARMLQQPYTVDFYNKQRTSSRSSAHEIVPFLVQLVRPQSVVDVGCGVGPWLSAFQEFGVRDILGIDGDYVDPLMLEIPTTSFMAWDLRQPISLPKSFDLVVSVEVAEHLPAAAAPTFIKSLTELGQIVFFSAAIPHQGGTDHVNEQWPEYWSVLFEERGFVPIDCVRERFWNNVNVEYFYSQNGMLYVHRNKLKELPEIAVTAYNNRPLSMVHPVLFYEILNKLSLKNEYYNMHNIPDSLGRTSFLYELKLIGRHLRFLPKVFWNALTQRLT